MDWNALLRSKLILFAIVNPVGGIPIFLQLTGKLDKGAFADAFQTAVLNSLAILFVFILAGRSILTYFFQDRRF
ncbi:MAG TPA: MarC family protein [Candidatus Omnitrophota bacterium]|nr:MarC family protein [Candidatus Omnitrophota bacterium]HQJ16175.1 MarC family protein [Candidatus Omnitrophota bacterium]